MGVYFPNYKFSKQGENNLFYEDEYSDTIKINTGKGSTFRFTGLTSMTKAYFKMPPTLSDLFLMILHLKDYTWLKVYQVSDLKLAFEEEALSPL